MPKIYLSPSTQEYNPYVTGNGSEEYFMNLVADAMEPYLLANVLHPPGKPRGLRLLSGPALQRLRPRQ